MTKKRITTETVANPLKESIFFTKQVAEKEEQTGEATSQTEKQPVGKKKPGRPRLARPTARHSFEFYKDQLVALRKLRAKKELATGESLTLSQLVREALDTFLRGQGEEVGE